MSHESDKYSLVDVEAVTVESDAIQSETTSNSETEKQSKPIKVTKSTTAKSAFTLKLTPTKLLLSSCISAVLGLALGFCIIALFKVELFHTKFDRDGTVTLSANHNPDHPNRPLKILASYKDFVEHEDFQSKLNKSGITFVRLIKDQNDSEQKKDLGEREVLGLWDDVDSINKAIYEKGIHKISLGTGEWAAPDQISHKNLYYVPTMGPVRDISKMEDWNNIYNKKLLMEFIKKAPSIESADNAEQKSLKNGAISAKAKELVIPSYENGIKDIMEKINSESSTANSDSVFPIMVKPQEAMGGHMNIKGSEDKDSEHGSDKTYVRLQNLRELKVFCRDRYINQYLIASVEVGGMGMNKDEAEKMVPAVDNIDLNIARSNDSPDEVASNRADIDKVENDMISYINKSFLFAHFVSSEFEDSVFWLIDENGTIIKWAQRRFTLDSADSIVHRGGYKDTEWIISNLDHLDRNGTKESVEIKNSMGEILRALNYKGLGCSDIRYENGDLTKPRLLEINPRICYSLTLKDDAGEWIREWVLQK